MRNFKLVLCYDGTKYNGWQRQGNTSNTIQEKLEQLLSRLLDQNIEVAGSGRTDAGVHAKGQVCSFKADTVMTCEQLLCEIRRYLPEDIGALSLEEVHDRFHARLNAREKTYVYTIWNSPDPNVFERKYTYTFREKLDISSMKLAASHLLGSHDFTSFCSNKHMKKTAVRTIYNIDIQLQDEKVIISYTGDGFLYNMVRILTGTLLEVGLGKKAPEDMEKILEEKNRSAAGFTAPANGLCLLNVKY